MHNPMCRLHAAMQPCITSHHLQSCCHINTCPPMILPLNGPPHLFSSSEPQHVPKQTVALRIWQTLIVAPAAQRLSCTTQISRACGVARCFGMGQCLFVGTLPLRCGRTQQTPATTNTRCCSGYVGSSHVIMSCKDGNLPSSFMVIIVATCECMHCSGFSRDAVRDGGAAVLRKARVRATGALAGLRASATCSSTLRARVLDKGPERVPTSRIKHHQLLLSYEADVRQYYTTIVRTSLLAERSELLF